MVYEWCSTLPYPACFFARSRSRHACCLHRAEQYLLSKYLFGWSWLIADGPTSRSRRRR